MKWCYMKVDNDMMRRIPLYFKYLQNIPQNIQALKLNAIAKDLSIPSKTVKGDIQILLGIERFREINREELFQAVYQHMLCKSASAVVLVGVGKIGKALLGYAGFSVYGLDILAGFDINEQLIRKGVSGKPVYPVNELEAICHRLNAKIAIIATPGISAQATCDALVRAGIVAIWNFSSVQLKAPSHMMIFNERMTDTLRSLAAYANTITQCDMSTDVQIGKD
ncbi:redox-sensing transcriptional repressor Rex [Caproiciproducens galactitolivorans]|uniref:Redox-sensing transcriptional repressor Rex n=2 Tax=Caproiciproducens galactitolivorans TaxID=642589 RepID=A0A4Z0YIM3_9FIRM|nr:redox-sensing transcriptional repressor Rex [Caproiciproducens galactitolivorans]TGJ76712.1 redox-sensing transcriptional repressor Rex [Caproiciproducens galactitolivorans]